MQPIVLEFLIWLGKFLVAYSIFFIVARTFIRKLQKSRPPKTTEPVKAAQQTP